MYLHKNVLNNDAQNKSLRDHASIKHRLLTDSKQGATQDKYD